MSTLSTTPTRRDPARWVMTSRPVVPGEFQVNPDFAGLPYPLGEVGKETPTNLTTTTRGNKAGPPPSALQSCAIGYQDG